MKAPQATPEANMTYSQGYDQALLDMLENNVRYPSPGWSQEYTDGYIAGEEAVLLNRSMQREMNTERTAVTS